VIDDGGGILRLFFLHTNLLILVLFSVFVSHVVEMKVKRVNKLN